MASPRRGGEPSWWVVVDGDLLWATIVVLSLALASGMPVESEKKWNLQDLKLVDHVFRGE